MLNMGKAQRVLGNKKCIPYIHVVADIHLGMKKPRPGILSSPSFHPYICRMHEHIDRLALQCPYLVLLSTPTTLAV